MTLRIFFMGACIATSLVGYTSNSNAADTTAAAEHQVSSAFQKAVLTILQPPLNTDFDVFWYRAIAYHRNRICDRGERNVLDTFLTLKQMKSITEIQAEGLSPLYAAAPKERVSVSDQTIKNLRSKHCPQSS